MVSTEGFLLPRRYTFEYINAYICVPRDIYKNVHSSTIHDNQKLEKIQMSVTSQMKSGTFYIEILSSNDKGTLNSISIKCMNFI